MKHHLISSLSKSSKFLSLLTLTTSLVGAGTCAIAAPDISSTQPDEIVWFDGSRSPRPTGQLLTGNTGYLGPAVSTGVTYSYPTPPDNAPDSYQGDAGKFGNRLLDGNIRGDWYVPVGMNFQPLVVDLDFGQIATLNEVVVAASRSKELKLARIEVKAEAEAPWSVALSLDSSSGELHRLRLPKPTPARWVRLTLQSAENITYLDEVWIWGDAKPKGPAGNGILPEMKDVKPGDQTILSPAQLTAWRRSSGSTKNELTWQLTPTWKLLGKDPLKTSFLPEKNTLRQPVVLTLTHTEGEAAAVQLVNATERPRDITVTLSPFKNAAGQVAPNLQGKLQVAGAIWTKRWGQTLRPLFTAENKLGGNLMEKYLTNGAVIKDFPELHLPARGTALLWFTVHTQNTPAGTYTAQINDGVNTIPITVKVLPLTMPTPDVWLHQWNHATQLLLDTQPFHDAEALEREVAFMQRDLGITVWSSLPTSGTEAETARALAKKDGAAKPRYKVRFMPPMTDRGYNNLLEPEKFDDAFRREVAENVRAVVQQTKELGLTYDEWALELWDEPNTSTIPDWAAVAEIIKAANPQIQLYMNPLFWKDTGFVDDATQQQYLDGWYNRLVDISVPILGQVDSKRYPEANRKFYDHSPRTVRAFFIHPCPGRMISWEAFRRGYNGWGFYSYYVPRADAWNDFDTAEFDYQIVYPGPRGPVPTIESESMRESWEDFRLLTLLKEQRQQKTLAQIIARYQQNLTDVPVDETVEDRQQRSLQLEKLFPEFRRQALQAASRPTPKP
jgi:hypothetical protein